jgi:hypothetical protein
MTILDDAVEKLALALNDASGESTRFIPAKNVVVLTSLSSSRGGVTNSRTTGAHSRRGEGSNTRSRQ